MKILVISYKKPSETVLKKLFLNDLSKNINILFITYENIISRLYIADKFKNKNKKNIKFFSVNNIPKLDKIINENKPNLILNYFIENFNYEFENLYSFLKKKNISMVKIIEHPFIWNKYLRRIRNKISKKKYIYDYGILCSKVAEYSHKHHSYKKKYFFCNMNYVSYRKSRTKINEDKKLNLFIDENFVNHPDVKIHKLKNFPSPKFYHKQLKFFFDFLKKTLKEKIYIAVHPTTLKNHFYKNKLIFRNTLNYVKKAKLVILHQTSAIDFAVLSKKNLLFITSDEINKLAEGKTIYRMAKYFNTRPLNLSVKYDSETIKKKIVLYKHNKRKYDMFVDDFIRHPKFKKIDKIEKIFNKMNSYN